MILKVSLTFVLILSLCAPIKATTLKEVTKPLEEAVTNAVQTTVEEVESAAKEAHTVGGKFLQSLINVMISASPGKTRVYLPAPSSDPNSGVTMGILPVFLFVNEKEEIAHILAPSITYNRIFKVNATMRYYWFPRKHAQMFMIGSYAVETNRRFTFRHEDPYFLRDWFYFKCDATTQRDGSLRFYGFGPNSKDSARANYTLRNNHFQLLTGVNFLEKFRLILSHRFRVAEIAEGPIDSLPQISSVTPRPKGALDAKSIFAQRLTLAYDSRDLPMAPSHGHTVNFFAEKAGHMGADIALERFGGELRGFYPANNPKFITGWRFLMEGETGDDTPFYEQSLLGGKDSLRGFGDARFIDRNKIIFSLEERIHLYTLKAFNVNVNFELTPFYESGTVIRNLNQIQPQDFHNVLGLGFRTIVKPNVVGIIDLGFSEEGTALFVGIDYPF